MLIDSKPMTKLLETQDMTNLVKPTNLAKLKKAMIAGNLAEIRKALQPWKRPEDTK